jgi:hypothetical protein
MRLNALTLGLATSAAVAVTVGTVAFLRSDSGAPFALAQTASIAEATSASPATLEVAQEIETPVSSSETASVRKSATPAQSPETIHTFDITFVTIDELGRALPSVELALGLDGRRLNELSDTDRDGRHHVVFTGAEPTLNAFIRTARGKMPTLARVQLRAGNPVELRLVADEPTAAAWDAFVHAASRKPVLESGFQEFSGSAQREPDGPAFLSEDGDPCTFTDPDLFRHVRVEGEDIPSGEWSSSRISCGGGGTQVSMSIVAHDESGARLAGIPCLALGDASSPLAGVTDAEGRFAIDFRRAWSLVVYVGGRDHALVRTLVDLQDHPAVLDVTVPRVAMALGKLVDPEGRPLAGWLVRAHATDALGNFIGSTITNAEGEFGFALPDRDPVELRVRPAPNLLAPTCVATRSFRGSILEPVEVVAPVSHTVGVTLHVDVPADIDGHAPVVRLVGRDSRETVELQPFESQERPEKMVRFGFRDDAVLPGDHALEVMTPGCEPLEIDSIRVGDVASDLGVFAPEPRPHLRIDGTDYGIVDGGRASVETKVQGVHVFSSTILLPGTFAVPKGDFVLYVAKRARKNGVPATKYPFHTVNGRVVPVEDAEKAPSPR